MRRSLMIAIAWLHTLSMLSVAFAVYFFMTDIPIWHIMLIPLVSSSVSMMKRVNEFSILRGNDHG